MPSILDQFDRRKSEFSTAKDAKIAKGNGFTAENAKIAEKKWFLIQINRVIFLLRPAVFFLSFAIFAPFAVKLGSGTWLIAD